MTGRKLTLSMSLPAALLFGAAAMLGPQNAPPPAKSAVVDIDAVLRAYPGAKQKLDQLNAMRAKWDAEMAKMRADIEAAQAERGALEEGTLEFARASLALEGMTRRYDGMGEVFQAQAAREFDRIRAELFEEVSGAVSAFAAANGYDIVLRWRDVAAEASVAKRWANYMDRDVLYRSNAADITAKMEKFILTWKPEKVQKPK